MRIRGDVLFAVVAVILTLGLLPVIGLPCSAPTTKATPNVSSSRPMFMFRDDLHAVTCYAPPAGYGDGFACVADRLVCPASSEVPK
jgi:hypothetical protein